MLLYTLVQFFVLLGQVIVLSPQILAGAEQSYSQETAKYEECSHYKQQGVFPGLDIALTGHESYFFSEAAHLLKFLLLVEPFLEFLGAGSGSGVDLVLKKSAQILQIWDVSTLEDWVLEADLAQ